MATARRAVYEPISRLQRENCYSFPWCSGIAVPTVFSVLSDISCRDQGRVCWAWSGLVGMKVELGHSLTLVDIVRDTMCLKEISEFDQ